MISIPKAMQELEQQEADEKADRVPGPVKHEEETTEGVITVQGEVLRIKRNNYLIRKFTGDVEHVHLDDTTRKTGTIRQGDRIVAKVDDQKHAWLIHPIPRIQ
jgi:hypothetical protein